MSEKKKTKEEKKPKQDKDLEQEEENDFGGLPDRDLKKSLGCG